VTTFQLCNCSSPTVILTISRQKEHRGSGPAHNMLGVVAACCFCWSWWGHCRLNAAVRVMWAAPPGLQHPHPQAPRQSKSRTQEAQWRSVALGLRVCEGLNYAKKRFSIKEKWKKFSSSHPILSYRRRIWEEIFRDEKPRIPLNSESATFGILRTRLVCGNGLLIIRVCDDGSVWWTIPDGGMVVLLNIYLFNLIIFISVCTSFSQMADNNKIIKISL